MRKKVFAAFLAIIGLSGIAVLGSTPELVNSLIDSVKNNPITRAFSTRTKNEPAFKNGRTAETNIQISDEVQLTEVPEAVLWSVIFTLPKRFNSEAEKARLAGEDDSLWKNYFVRQAKISLTSDQILREIAADYNAEVDPLDEQARSIIQEIREKNPPPPNLRPDKNNLAEIPESLTGLQLQRDEVALRYRDRFRNTIGEEEFAKFSEFIVTQLAKGFVRQELKPGEPAQYSEGENNGFEPFITTGRGGDLQ